MISRAFAFLLAVSVPASAVPAQAQTPLPPSVLEGGAGEASRARKPAKPRPKPAKPSEVGAATRAATKATPQRGYPETLPLPRRIDRDEIADPYGGGGAGGSRLSPMMTPSGRPGMGGRF
jgi:hypothetical protein